MLFDRINLVSLSILKNKPKQSEIAKAATFDLSSEAANVDYCPPMQGLAKHTEFAPRIAVIGIMLLDHYSAKYGRLSPRSYW